jgi:hypothetical protein
MGFFRAMYFGGTLHLRLFGEGDLFEITGGMQNSEHFNAGVGGPEVKAKVAEWIAAAVFCEFGAGSPDAVPLGDVLELCPKVQQQPVCLENTVLGDIVPNLIKIPVSQS